MILHMINISKMIMIHLKIKCLMTNLNRFQVKKRQLGIKGSFNFKNNREELQAKLSCLTEMILIESFNLHSFIL